MILSHVGRSAKALHKRFFASRPQRPLARYARPCSLSPMYEFDAWSPGRALIPLLLLRAH